MQTPNEIFEETPKDVHLAESAIPKALPKMAKRASSEDLKAVFVGDDEAKRGRRTHKSK